MDTPCRRTSFESTPGGNLHRQHGGEVQGLFRKRLAHSSSSSLVYSVHVPKLLVAGRCQVSRVALKMPGLAVVEMLGAKEAVTACRSIKS